MKSKAKATVHVEKVRGVLRETFDIEGRLKRSPYGMVAGALGMGFVLGGGLFTRLTAAYALCPQPGAWQPNHHPDGGAAHP